MSKGLPFKYCTTLFLSILSLKQPQIIIFVWKHWYCLLQIEKRDNQNALVLPLLFVFIIIVDCCSRSQQICQSIALSWSLTAVEASVFKVSYCYWLYCIGPETAKIQKCQTIFRWEFFVFDLRIIFL